MKIRGALSDELVAVRAQVPPDATSGCVFPDARGQTVEGARCHSEACKLQSRRVQLAAVPDGLTPHSLRRTFASVLCALGEDPGVVMDEMGHTDPVLALRVYRQAMRRGDDEKRQLRRLVEGCRPELAHGCRWLGGLWQNASA